MADPNVQLICATAVTLGKYVLIGWVVYLVYKWWKD